MSPNPGPAPDSAKDRLLAALLDELGGPASQPIRPRADASQDAPLSYTQETLWLLHQLSPGMRAYNVRWALRIHGALRVDALSRALTMLVERQVSLRTVCVADADVPRQRVVRAGEFPLRRTDLRHLVPAAREDAVQAVLRESAGRPWEFSVDTLRADLLQVDDDEAVLLFSFHHIYCDGWSRAIFFRELRACYEACVSASPVQLQPLAVQYPDFAEWQRHGDGGRAIEQELDYWRGRLAGAPAAMSLPTDRPRPRLQSYRGAREVVRLDPRLAASVRSLAEPGRYTLFMVLLSVYKVLLQRLSGSDDIVVGTPVAGRTRTELEGIIGCFVNALVLRTTLTDDPTFAQLLDRVRETCLGAFDHQNVPFEQLLQDLRPERDLSMSPLFQVMFILQNMPADMRELAGLRVSPVDLDHESAKFDLTLSATELGDTIQLTLGYNTDLYDAATARRLLGHLETILRAVTTDPNCRTARIPLLSPDQEAVMLAQDATVVPYPEQACVHELVEEQARLRPDAVALEGGSESLTYAELNRRANRMARALRARGVARGDAVGVCLSRQLGLPVTLLAVMKAGGACVPLDPDYPPQRLADMVRDARVKLVVAADAAAARASLSTECVSLDELDVGGDDELPPVATGSDVAFVLFTSGSTGVPRAVRLAHRGFVNHHLAAIPLYGLSRTDRVLQFASPSFDISIEEIFPTWCAGGTVVLRPDVYSGADFIDWLSARRITVLNLPTAYWHEWTRELEVLRLAPPGSLRLVIVGGERADATVLASWRRLAGERVRWVNTYGPTEASIIATAFEPQAADFATYERGEAEIPIGRAIANARTYVVDSSGQFAPIGVPGELLLGGPGIALGYLNGDASAAERFGPDRFGGPLGGRVYRTGDRVRRRADGMLEFLGRVDGQIKIRGHRVEPGEIEARIRRDPRVLDVAVIARGTGTTTRLVAYVVMRPGLASTASLHDSLRAQLPEHMVPAAIVPLDALPLTPNGKLDRRALPPASGPEHEDSAMPAGHREEAIAGIWREVLDCSRVTIDENFFDLGGHSLLAMRVLSRIRATLGVTVSLRQFFEAPTVAGLARRVADAEPAVSPTTDASLTASSDAAHATAVSIPRRDVASAPATFAQEVLWLLQRNTPDLSAYNVAEAWQVDGDLDVHALHESLRLLIDRHPALRTAFRQTHSGVAQVIEPAPASVLETVDLRSVSAVSRQDAAMAVVRMHARAAFDLGAGSLLRATLIQLGSDQHILLLVVHHIVYDGWSRGIVLRELSAAYAALVAGRAPDLAPVPVRFFDYAWNERERLQGEELARQIEYWSARLSGATLDAGILADRPRARNLLFTGATKSSVFRADLLEALRSLARENDATLFMVLFAAFETLLHRYGNQEDLVVGTLTAGRSQPGVEGVVGYFVNTLAIRTSFADDPAFTTVLARVRDGYLEASEHADVPFQQLAQELRLKQDGAGAPVCQAMFVFQNNAPGEIQLGTASLHPIATDHETTKFDLYLSMRERRDGLHAMLKYRADLFEAGTIDRLMQHFHVLLESIVANPGCRVADLAIMATGEHREVVEEFNSTAVDYPRGETLRDLVESQASRTPHAVAVEYAGAFLTFADLDARATALATWLRGQGAARGSLVGICLERSIEMVVALIAVVKCGAAYVPLDPELPVERLAFMLADAEPRVVLTLRRHVEQLRPFGGRVLMLDAQWDDVLAGAIGGRSEQRPGPDDPAYLIYTSGSTGRPKGALNSHRGIVNRLRWMQDSYSLTPVDAVLQKTPFSFDVSVWEFFWPLSTGARLVLAEPGGHRNPEYLAETIASRHITVLHFVPSMLRAFLDDRNASTRCRSVRDVICSGEALPAELVRRFFGQLPWARLHNLYGPTEAGVDVTAWTCRADEAGSTVPIGRPIANTRIYVLDGKLRPVPVGIPGELFIGGVQVGLGYHRRPELSAERFLPDPFRLLPGSRMYRSGDRARWRDDGSIEYLGRLDTQIKLNGHRIELGEIEATLTQCPGVSAATVLLHEEPSGDRRIVAYIAGTPGETISTPSIRVELRQHLPAVMIPSTIVILDSLPLTPSGKIDRRALPSPSHDERMIIEEFVPPRTALEAEICDVWASALGVDRVGVHDDFFDLGGNSLRAMRMIAEVERRWGRRLPLDTLFQRPTVAQVVAALVSAAREEEGDREIPVLQPEGPDTPFIFVHGDLMSYGWYCRALAPMLGSSPMVVLPTLGPHTRGVPLTIEAMATAHLAAVRRFQPSGPYRLGGYCHGGLIAYEMARQLVARGETVEGLVMVDAFCSNLRIRIAEPLVRLFSRSPTPELTVERRAFAHSRIQYYAQRVRHVRQLRMTDRIRWMWRLLRRKAGVPISETLSAPEISAETTLLASSHPTDAGEPLPQRVDLGVGGRFIARAQRAYMPGRYSGAVDLIWASKALGGGWPVFSRLWNAVAPRARHHALEGTHVSIVMPHGLPSLAERITACFRREPDS